MENYVGKWELMPAETSGFDEFSDAIGSPKQGRQAVKGLVYVVEYSHSGDDWKVKAEVKGFGEAKEYTWTPAVEFEYQGLDGSAMKSTISWDGSKCVEQHASTSSSWNSTRVVEGDTMTVTSVKDGVTMIQKFQRL